VEFRTKLHTILMLIGPTECGKTTFAKQVLMPGLCFADASRNVKANIQYLSSDQIRQEILGHDYDKYDQIMVEISEQAFQLLFERLKVATSFPVNAEFVILDTTGLSAEFRTKVKEIAAHHNYHLEAVVFDYRDRDDYYASERSKKLISNHIHRLKREVLGSLAGEGYERIHKVRAKDFYLPADAKANPEYRVIIEDQVDYLDCVLPQNQQYIVIGDVHECVDDLKALLIDYGYQLDGNQLVVPEKLRHTKLIQVGDWIDKGKQTKQIIEFLCANQEHFYLVMGNHENFVDKYMSGKISEVDQELLHTYFDSTQVLSNDEALLGQFRHLVSLSKPFYRYIGAKAPSFFVTHAPCRNQYIGKLDANSVRHQRNFRIDREALLDGQLQFLQEESVKNQPFHVFGHVAAKFSCRFQNKIHLDTGCVHGNQLTAVSMSHKPTLRSRKSQRVAITEELPILFKEEKKISLAELGEDEVRRLHYCARHQINFISGTMSPADLDPERNELESLQRGLDYFRERGVEQVVLQPKYMGSRCNIYLHRDIEKCFAVSRNGYKIHHIDLSDIYVKLLRKFGGYMAEERIAMLIFDGELLPWKVLGEGLIERQFEPIERALGSELTFLQLNGFEPAYHQLMEAYAESGFEKDQHHLAKSVLSEKYGSSTYQTYKYIHEIRDTYVPLSEHLQAYETYKRQLEWYAQDGNMEYKPFALLKMIYVDGSEQIPEWKTSEQYAFLSEDEALTLNLSDPGCLDEAQRFFSKLTMENHMEGVVIKPELWSGKTVPYMKVRNPDYLSIIYGYDYQFPHKYRKLLKQKNIKQKLRTSLIEYRLGLQMLKIPFDEISPDHQAYQEIAASLLFEVAQEREIDPRL
jgi:predicted kinase